MPKLLLDQFHLSIFVSKDLPASACRTAHRTLNQVRFAAELRRAIRAVFQRYPSLSRTTQTLSR